LCTACALVVDPACVFAAFIDALVAPGAFGAGWAAATAAERIRLRLEVEAQRVLPELGYPFVILR
jgi:hypothetical protein